ncbi:MAG: hypothetical protein AAF800_06040 [Planctomycetota bacterium]
MTDEFSRLLFEDPGWAVVACVAVSAGLRIVGKRRGDRRAVLVSYAALALGLGVFTLAYFVTTDREALIARTEALVAATSPADEPALSDLFDDRALLVGPGGAVWDDLTAAFVAGELEKHDVTENQVRAVDAASDGSWGSEGSGGTSTLDVSSRVNGFPMRTQWQLDWARGEDGVWRLTTLRWLRFNQREPSPSLYR